ncbi:MAG: FmdB family zinc ribbon protein [Micromonosporaceae bacterium]
MPTYTYRCRACTQTFELQRSMSESDARATCPDGHHDTVKLLSTVAFTGSSSGQAAVSEAPSGGGCCGGGCCG